eukprot:PhF_6_TR9589/c0_g1_i2/m.14844
MMVLKKGSWVYRNLSHKSQYEWLGPFYNSYQLQRKWFVYLDSLYVIILSTVSALDTSTEAMCFRNSGIVLLTVCSHNACVIYLQPHHTQREYILAALCGTLEFFASSFAVASYVVGGDTVVVTKMGGYTSTVCMMLMSLMIFLLGVMQRGVNGYSFLVNKWKQKKTKRINGTQYLAKHNFSGLNDDHKNNTMTTLNAESSEEVELCLLPSIMDSVSKNNDTNKYKSISLEVNLGPPVTRSMSTRKERMSRTLQGSTQVKIFEL